MSRKITDLYDSWKDEKKSSYLYGILAEKEKNPKFASLFLSLQKEAEKQALIWEKLITETSEESIDLCYRPPFRVKVIGSCIKKWGIFPFLKILPAMKVRGLSVYQQPSLNSHSMPKNLQEVGNRHQSIGTGGGFRAAVFGVNDGLVSNASLMFGMAGAESSAAIILLAGIGGLLAGALSMAAGEYLSMKSQKELFEYQIGLEREELKMYPLEEAEELALIYEAKGLTREEAQNIAHKMVQNPSQALETLSREELGLNPEDLGSPFGAALFSFLAFAGGAILPLIPFLIFSSQKALLVSIGVTGFSLFGIGSFLSLFTGRSGLKGGLRMLAIGGGAGIITYLLGKLIGGG